jgi:hypothetical protein
MPSPAIRMSRPKPIKVLQELASTEAAARTINRIDFITRRHSANSMRGKQIL